MAVIQVSPDLLLQYGTVTVDLSTTGTKTLAITFDEAFASLMAYDATLVYGAANMDASLSAYDGSNLNTEPTTSGMTLMIIVTVAGSATNRVRWWAIGAKKRGAVYAR